MCYIQRRKKRMEIYNILIIIAFVLFMIIICLAFAYWYITYKKKKRKLFPVFINGLLYTYRKTKKVRRNLIH